MKKVRNYFSPFLILSKRFIKCYKIVKTVVLEGPKHILVSNLCVHATIKDYEVYLLSLQKKKIFIIFATSLSNIFSKLKHLNS